MTVDSAQLPGSSSNEPWYRDSATYATLGPMVMLYGTFLREIHGASVAVVLTIGGLIISAAARRANGRTKLRLPYVDRDASQLCWSGTLLALLGLALLMGAWMLGLEPLSRLYGLAVCAVGSLLLLVDARRSYR